tara:strand:+ start:539 stop:652 length:114 start_codon:yes stop_codon:yes gene_type:complete
MKKFNQPLFRNNNRIKTFPISVASSKKFIPEFISSTA